MGTEPAERDRTFQRADHLVDAVGGGEARELLEIPASELIPAAAAALMNVSAMGPNPQNAISAADLGRTARAGAGLGPPVVVIVDGRPTRSSTRMLSDDRPQQDGLHDPIGDADFDVAADVFDRNRVTRGTDPDAREPVDFPDDLGP